MAKKKNNRKKSVKPQSLSPKSYIKKKARKLPVEKCLINDDWKDSGMATIIVVRKMASGKLIVGTYIVDVFCLGLKDTHHWFNIFMDDFEEQILDVFENAMDLNMIDCEPKLAYNIVYGAIEYAEDLGFQPHKDFGISEYILDDVEEIEFIDVEFGKNGRPNYFSGPHDNVAKVLNTLMKNVGEGNFDFTAGIPEGLMGDNLFLDDDFEDDLEDGFVDFEEVE